jgi:hypothetical protein
MNGARASELSTRIALGLIAAGKVGGMSTWAMLDAATAAISERSGAVAGDKTILVAPCRT